jgi:hypothetical protein
VENVVVGGVGIGDVLERDAADEGADIRIFGLQQPVGPVIGGLHVVDELVDHELGRVEHRR